MSQFIELSRYLMGKDSPRVFPSNVLLSAAVVEMGILVQHKGRLAFTAGTNGPDPIWFLLNTHTIRNCNLNSPAFVSDGEYWHEVISRNVGLATPRFVYIKESDYLLTNVDQELIQATIGHYMTGMKEME